MGKIKFLFLSIILIGCGLKKVTHGKVVDKDSEVLEAKISSTKSNSDPVIINSVNVDGNYLLLEISYIGGCKRHYFEVIGSSSISKSIPPIRSIQLIHTSDKDTCGIVISEKLKVDISEFAYKKERGNEIYLTLNGWKDKVKYIYK